MAVTTAHLDDIPLSNSPFLEQALERDGLEPAVAEKVRAFARDGFVILDLDVPNFDGLAEEIVESLRRRQETVTSRVHDAWRYCEAVRELAGRPEVLGMLRALYRRAAIPFQTLNFSVGTQQSTHSDLIHFSAIPWGFMAGVWFALEDVDADNGPLHYYPGSHLLPFYDLQAVGLGMTTFSQKHQAYARYERFISDQVAARGLEKRTVRMKKGQCLVWAANLLHGGDRILDPSRSRHTQVTHYYFEGCRYFSPLYSDVYKGRIAWTAIRDVRTGKEVPHVVDGVRHRLPLSAMAKGTLLHRLGSTPTGVRALDLAERLLRRG